MPTESTSDDASRLKFETYQTDATGNSGRKRAEDVDSWTQPLRQPLVATARFVKFSNLILKNDEDSGGRVANVQLGGKWMRKKVRLGLFLVGFQGGLEDSLEA